MAKKIAIEVFNGVAPSVPDHSLPENAASKAVNVRLTNTAIRPIYQPGDSDDLDDANADLSIMLDVGRAYTNYFKASYDVPIQWLAWTPVDRHVSLLEKRFNEVDNYPFPEDGTDSANGTLNVVFRGTYTLYTGDATCPYRSDRSQTETSDAPQLLYLPAAGVVTQQVTADVDPLLGNITSYFWQYLDGDASITINDPANVTPTFSGTMPVPTEPGTEKTIEARWRCTITDDLGNSFDFIDNGDGNYIWTATDTFGTTGLQYYLTIDHNGNSYTALSSIKRVPPLDSITFSLEEGNSFIDDFYYSEFFAFSG